MTPPVCDECMGHVHSHVGKCGKPAKLVIKTAGRDLEKSTTCACEAVGRRNADTQMEVAFR